MFFAKLSSIYEPYALNREIIGFDTFAGFPSINNKDNICHAKKGQFDDAELDVLKKSIKLFDCNRPVGHINKVKLVEGDACKTIPKYFKDNPHTLVALLYLDFDLYEPTKTALETILPRMPKGSVLAFDQLNQERWKGETMALLDSLDINRHEIKKDHADPHICHIVL